MQIKKLFFICFMFLFSVSIYAQTENQRDSLQVEKMDPLHEFQDLRYNDSIHVTKETQNDYNKISPEEQRRREVFVQSLLFLTPELYQGPPPTPDLEKGYKPGKVESFTKDYNFFNGYSLTQGLALTTNSTRKTYMGMGGLYMISADLHYQPWSWLTVTGGMYTAKYSIAGPEGLMHFNDLGFNASMRFKLHDRIYLHAHGMYSVNSNDKNRNFRPSMMNMYPQTYYGGGIEFKVSEKFGVEGGMVRELNPMNGKWQNRPYIMPIFYSTGR